VTGGGGVLVGLIQEAYLVVGVGLVVWRYRSTPQAFRTGRNPLMVLIRPVVVLAVAYIGGLNVPTIAEVLSPLVPPAFSEPVLYTATFFAVIGVSLLPILRPHQDESDKPM